MNLISSADLDWGIGYQNELLFRTRQDMQHVKELTTGNVIVMGRNTFFRCRGKSRCPTASMWCSAKRTILGATTSLCAKISRRCLRTLPNMTPQAFLCLAGKAYTRSCCRIATRHTSRNMIPAGSTTLFCRVFPSCRSGHSLSALRKKARTACSLRLIFTGVFPPFNSPCHRARQVPYTNKRAFPLRFAEERPFLFFCNLEGYPPLSDACRVVHNTRIPVFSLTRQRGIPPQSTQTDCW